jgi:hypothetical protein
MSGWWNPIPSNEERDTRSMDEATAQALAEGYLAYTVSGDDAVLRMFSPDFFDNVSGRFGLGIFGVVREWLDQSLAERSAELHLVTHTRTRW